MCYTILNGCSWRDMDNRSVCFSATPKNDTGTRSNRIGLDGSYQRAYFSYPPNLLMDGNRISVVTEWRETTFDVIDDLTQVKVTQFESVEDWFAYLGDPERTPSWYTNLAVRIQNATTQEEVRLAVADAADVLSQAGNKQIKKLEIEKWIELSYVNQPGLLELLERGLEFQENQVETPIGRMDLLCRGSDGKYVVVEIKAGAVEDGAFGQILRYMGWVHAHFDGGRDNVRGMLLAGEFSEKARYSRIGLLREDASEWLKFKKHGFVGESVE